MAQSKQRAGLAAIFQRTAVADEDDVKTTVTDATTASEPPQSLIIATGVVPDSVVQQVSPPQDDQFKQIDLDAGRFRSVGIGLRDGEIEALDFIANVAGVKRNAVLRYAVRHFLRQYAQGNAHLEMEQQTTVTLRLP